LQESDHVTTLGTTTEAGIMDRKEQYEPPRLEWQGGFTQVIGVSLPIGTNLLEEFSDDLEEQL
jgi:hypothetical protein